MTFDTAIVATGSNPTVPPIFQLDDDRVMDSTGALELKDVPKEIVGRRRGIHRIRNGIRLRSTWLGSHCRRNDRRPSSRCRP